MSHPRHLVDFDAPLPSATRSGPESASSADAISLGRSSGQPDDFPAVDGERTRSDGFSIAKIAPYARLLRPKQWSKNSFCLAGVLFTDHYFNLSSDLAALATAGVFCAASSAQYVFNDIIDCDRDRNHPSKCRRPIASGEASVPVAIALGLTLTLLALVGAALLHPAVLTCVALQSINNILYSYRFKHEPIFDVISIAIGFVIRLMAGVYVIGEIPTTWIVLCTFFLALFLGFGKRRGELARVEKDETIAPESQRPVLDHYTVGYLDFLVNATGVMALICYALSTTTGENPTLVLTVPVVFYAIMHYKRMVMVSQSGEEPEEIVLRDASLQWSVAIWLVSYLAILHTDLRLLR